MSLNITWNDSLKTTFINQLEIVSSSIQKDKRSHSYLSLKNGQIKSVNNKAEACSYHQFLEAFTFLILKMNLETNELKSLQNSVKVINEAFKSKKPSFFHRLPIISCIYKNKKRKLIKLGGESENLLSKFVTENSQSVQLQKVLDQNKGIVVENRKEAVEKLKDETAGKYYIWDTEDYKVGMLIKPPFAPPASKEAIFIDSASVQSKGLDSFANKAMSDWFAKQGRMASSKAEAKNLLLKNSEISAILCKDNDEDGDRIFIKIPGFMKEELIIPYFCSASFFETYEEALSNRKTIFSLKDKGIYKDGSLDEVKKDWPKTSAGYVIVKDPSNEENFIFVQKFEIGNTVHFREEPINKQDNLFEKLKKYVSETHSYSKTAF